jgi:hypothetical protein
MLTSVRREEMPNCTQMRQPFHSPALSFRSALRVQECDPESILDQYLCASNGLLQVLKVQHPHDTSGSSLPMFKDLEHSFQTYKYSGQVTMLRLWIQKKVAILLQVFGKKLPHWIWAKPYL